MYFNCFELIIFIFAIMIIENSSSLKILLRNSLKSLNFQRANGLRIHRKFTSFKSFNPSEPKNSERIKKLNELVKEYQMDKKRKIFEENMKFPTTFTIKIVGVNEPMFIEDMIELAANCLEINKSMISHNFKKSDKSNYISISLTLDFQSSSQLYTLYEQFPKDKRVKFVI